MRSKEKPGTVYAVQIIRSGWPNDVSKRNPLTYTAEDTFTLNNPTRTGYRQKDNKENNKKNIRYIVGVLTLVIGLVSLIISLVKKKKRKQ